MQYTTPMCISVPKMKSYQTRCDMTEIERSYVGIRAFCEDCLDIALSHKHFLSKDGTVIYIYIHHFYNLSNTLKRNVS
ncbi:unnamed protein product [Schistosoma spindalis]|nr:unnamed protein product [Schistosoma spindale]